MDKTSKRDILYYPEIESYVEALQCIPLERIGSLRWFEQHEMFEKLNLQALYEARNHCEEVVCDRVIFFGRGSVLVQQLIAQDVWNENVFPRALKYFRPGHQAFPTYMVLYQAVTLSSFLESLTFHRSFCEVLDETAIDLVDLCYSAIVRVMDRKKRPNLKKTETKSAELTKPEGSQLKDQKEDIDLILSLKCIGILCHLVQQAEVLPLSVLTRMCDHHDLPLFFAGLLEHNPWTTKCDGLYYKFVEGEWKEVPESNRLLLTRTEGQLWIALHQMLLAPEFTKKYSLDNCRKDRLIRVASMINETLIDQIPALANIQRYLHTLNFMQTPSTKKGLILEQTPIIREQLLEVYRHRWDELARMHLETLCADTNLLKAIANRISDVYTTDNMEPVLPEPAKCGLCGHPAKQRCSNCHQEWYCRRECQVKHWPKHKAACAILKNDPQPNEECQSTIIQIE